MKPTTVDTYILQAPKAIQPRLQQLRRIIITLVPTAKERISYGMPFYEYKGRLVYFAPMKNHIGLYIPPPIIENHAKDLAGYTTTKSAVHLSLTKPFPVGLITKLIRARIKHLERMEKKQ